jgi:putative tricarboxylic transport membrane protein
MQHFSLNLRQTGANPMNIFGQTRQLLAAAGISFVALSGVAHAEGHKMMDRVHFLIPGGAGGGWDGTARAAGDALVRAGLIDTATYENMSGGGGGVAISDLIENADSRQDTLMVNSTPILIRALTGEIGNSFRELSLVAGIVGDYAVLAVPSDSPIQTMEDALAMYRADPASLTIGGGSVPGGMDQLVAAIVLQGAGENPTGLNYVGYDAGGEAMAGLLSGEVVALSTGFSEVVGLASQGVIRVLGVTAPERVAAFDAAPTFAEQGIDAEFVNWRGFFAAPGMPQDKLTAYQDLLAAMMQTPEWQQTAASMGLINIFNAGDDFKEFLRAQERIIAVLVRDLGFI